MGGDSFGLMFTVVPALFGIVGLVIVLRALWDLRRGAQLARHGVPVQGRVVAAHVKSTGSREHRSSRMVETIEFTSGRGQSVREIPAVSDVGMLDRTGSTVTVLHDRDRPELFIAPRDGRRMSPWPQLRRAGFGVVFMVFSGVFLVFSRMVMFGF